jgi:hypothetical protein
MDIVRLEKHGAMVQVADWPHHTSTNARSAAELTHKA